MELAADGGKGYNSINDTDNPTKPESKLRFFPLLVLLFNILAISTLTLLGLWRGQYGGGFNWTSAINYHILFCSIGFLVFYAYGMMMFRLTRNVSRIRAKIAHTVVYVLALAFIVFGLNRVWGAVNLTSLHSWVAFAAVVLFFLQWLMGFVTFLVPGLSGGFKAWYKPNHVFWGVAIFACGCAAMLTGAMEEAAHNEAGSTEAYLANSFAIGVLATGITATYITCQSDYARKG